MKEAKVHSLSDVQSKQIGAGTAVWQFTVILPGARIGKACNICAQCFIENDVVVGDRVTVKCGVQLWDGTRIGDDAFIGPNVTFTNDLFPRSKEYPDQFPVTHIQAGASIGGNSTILPGITIGRNAMIGAGAVVTRDVPPYAIMKGNPARIAGYTRKRGRKESNPECAEEPAEKMAGVDLVKFKTAKDLRGDLLAVELDKQIPFDVRRMFYVMNVPSHHMRGEHAHHECHQLLVCLKGKITVTADNGNARQEWILDGPQVGLHLHPLIWAAQWNYSPDAVLAVFASHSYDPKDYIRDYEDYLRTVAS